MRYKEPKHMPTRATLKRWVRETLELRNARDELRSWTAVSLVNHLRMTKSNKAMDIRGYYLKWRNGHQDYHHEIDTAVLEILREMERLGEVSTRYGHRAKPENVMFFKQFTLRPLLEQLAAI